MFIFDLIYFMFKLPFIILGWILRISFILIFWPFMIIAWILKIIFAIALFDWIIGLLFPVRYRCW